MQLVVLDWGVSPPRPLCLRLETGPPGSPSLRLRVLSAARSLAGQTAAKLWCLPARASSASGDHRLHRVLAVVVPRVPHVQIVFSPASGDPAARPVPHSFAAHQGAGYSVWVTEPPPPLSTPLGVGAGSSLARLTPPAYRASRCRTQINSAGVAVLRNKRAYRVFHATSSGVGTLLRGQAPDFRREVAIVVHRGTIGNAGYSMRVQSASVDRDSLRLRVQVTSVWPAPTVPSHPALMIVAPRRAKVEVTLTRDRRNETPLMPWSPGFSAFQGPNLQLRVKR